MRTGNTKRIGYGYLSDAVGAMFAHLDALPTRDLITVRRAIPRLSTSNCGWSEYHAADLVDEMVEGILHSRKLLAKKAKKDGCRA